MDLAQIKPHPRKTTSVSGPLHCTSGYQSPLDGACLPQPPTATDFEITTSQPLGKREVGSDVPVVFPVYTLISGGEGWCRNQVVPSSGGPQIRACVLSLQAPPVVIIEVCALVGETFPCITTIPLPAVGTISTHNLVGSFSLTSTYLTLVGLPPYSFICAVREGPRGPGFNKIDHFLLGLQVPLWCAVQTTKTCSTTRSETNCFSGSENPRLDRRVHVHFDGQCTSPVKSNRRYSAVCMLALVAILRERRSHFSIDIVWDNSASCPKRVIVTPMVFHPAVSVNLLTPHNKKMFFTIENSKK